MNLALLFELSPKHINFQNTTKQFVEGYAMSGSPDAKYKVRGNTVREKIINFLGDSDEEVSTIEIYDALKGKYTTIKAILNQMRKRGEIVMVKQWTANECATWRLP